MMPFAYPFPPFVMEKTIMSFKISYEKYGKVQSRAASAEQQPAAFVRGAEQSDGMSAASAVQQPALQQQLAVQLSAASQRRAASTMQQPACSSRFGVAGALTMRGVPRRSEATREIGRVWQKN